MGDAAEGDKATATGMESPADFLTKLGETLCAKADVDVGLAAILAKHLLTAAPSGDAVTKARAAILTLASERARLPHRDSAND